MAEDKKDEKKKAPAKVAKKDSAPKAAETKKAAPKKTAEKKAAPSSKAAESGKSKQKASTAKASGKTVTVTQTGSPVGRQAYQRATLVGLGLNKMHKTRTLEDTPSVRGMINAVRHLVKVEDAA